MSESGSTVPRTPARISTVQDVVKRVQRLCDTPRPRDGIALATYVEGYFLGDITAIVAAKIRAERLPEG